MFFQKNLYFFKFSVLIKIMKNKKTPIKYKEIIKFIYFYILNYFSFLKKLAVMGRFSKDFLFSLKIGDGLPISPFSLETTSLVG